MKKSSLRILLLLCVNFVLLFAVYQVMLRLEFLWGSVLYLVAAAGLTIAYYVINRGFGRPEDGADALPADWDPIKKGAYLEKRRAEHARAKKLLYWLFPLILVIAIDFIDLFLLDSFRDALSRLS